MQGVYTILPTPFQADGALDLASLRRVVDLVVAAGVDGVTALGVAGEVARLDERERRQVVETVVEHVRGRVPVVVGTTADGTRTCIAYSREAQVLGAAAVMVSPPRLNKLSSEAVVAHFKAVGDAIGLPIVVQDFPPITGYTLEPTLLARVAREVATATTIKLEDPPTPAKTVRIRQACDGMAVDILGGLGGVFLLEELIAGTSGVMTGFAYPEVLVDVVRRYRAGDVDGAAETFYRCVPLMRFEFQEGIGMAIRKELYRRRGALGDAATRAPGASLDRATLEALERLLRWTGRWEGAPWISV